jgi:hypothetical protein
LTIMPGYSSSSQPRTMWSYTSSSASISCISRKTSSLGNGQQWPRNTISTAESKKKVCACYPDNHLHLHPRMLQCLWYWDES